jgi:hypothetical protein
MNHREVEERFTVGGRPRFTGDQEITEEYFTGRDTSQGDQEIKEDDS